MLLSSRILLELVVDTTRTNHEFDGLAAAGEATNPLTSILLVSTHNHSKPSASGLVGTSNIYKSDKADASWGYNLENL